MKKYFLKWASSLLALMMPWVTFAQTKGIYGKVVDEKGEPIPFVNAVLMSLPDSTIVHGTVTDEQGFFKMNTDVDLAVLQLSMLGEAVVKGFMPKTKLTGNSMITTIQGTVLGNSGTAEEMLSKVPGMTQRDDKLEVIGKGAPVFYINGRKVQDAEELKNLHSNEIHNVEVITNPGAIYDATVSSVVRIRTTYPYGKEAGILLGSQQHVPIQEKLAVGSESECDDQR